MVRALPYRGHLRMRCADVCEDAPLQLYLGVAGGGLAEIAIKIAVAGSQLGDSGG